MKTNFSVDDMRLLTVVEASKLLNLSKSKTYSLADSGSIPYVDLNNNEKRRCLRFKPKDILEFIEKNTVKN